MVFKFRSLVFTANMTKASLLGGALPCNSPLPRDDDKKRRVNDHVFFPLVKSQLLFTNNGLLFMVAFILEFYVEILQMKLV